MVVNSDDPTPSGLNYDEDEDDVDPGEDIPDINAFEDEGEAGAEPKGDVPGSDARDDETDDGVESGGDVPDVDIYAACLEENKL